jgi:hypothetical protein
MANELERSIAAGTKPSAMADSARQLHEELLNLAGRLCQA